MSTLFVNNIKHTNDTSAMTIDSAGRILTPARPAFRAEKRASNQNLSDSASAKITFEHEAFDIGYEEYFMGDDYCFVEWPENISNLIEDDMVKIKINLDGKIRLIEIIL